MHIKCYTFLVRYSWLQTALHTCTYSRKTENRICLAASWLGATTAAPTASITMRIKILEIVIIVAITERERERECTRLVSILFLSFSIKTCMASDILSICIMFFSFTNYSVVFINVFFLFLVFFEQANDIQTSFDSNISTTVLFSLNFVICFCRV